MTTIWQWAGPTGYPADSSDGEDYAFGENGDDVLVAFKRRSQLAGGPGDDVLSFISSLRSSGLGCGTGRDTLTGGLTGQFLSADCEDTQISGRGVGHRGALLHLRRQRTRKLLLGRRELLIRGATSRSVRVRVRRSARSALQRRAAPMLQIGFRGSCVDRSRVKQRFVHGWRTRLALRPRGR